MDYDLRNQDEYSVPLSELNNLGEIPSLYYQLPGTSYVMSYVFNIIEPFSE
jgi:hypothetical protein